MNNIASNEIEKMKHLINFGGDVQKPTNSLAPILEYQEKGADGLNYAIAKENSKYYIMVAPKKDTKLVAEDYEHLSSKNKLKGYDSYNVASKQFELKMRSLREAHEPKAEIITEDVKPAEWQTVETTGMRESIERLKQISNNVEYILAEDKSNVVKAYGETVGNVDTSWTNDDEEAKPHVEEPVGKTNISPSKEWTDDNEMADLTKTDINPNNEGQKTKDGAQKSTGYDEMADLRKTDINPNTNKGKTVKLTEEQVLAWSGNENYMDKSNGTEIGSSAPFVDCPESECCDEADNGVILEFELDSSYYGDEDTSGPIFIDDDELDDEELYRRAGELEKSMKNGKGFEDAYKDVVKDLDYVDGSEPNDSDYADKLTDLVMEAILNDFGKHPAYRKEPFTHPGNNEPASKDWARRWDSEDNLNDVEYGKEIGHNGDPYSEVVEYLTDAIMDRLSQKKK